MCDMNDSNPVSLRLTLEEQESLKIIGGGKSVAAGVRELLKLYESKMLNSEQSDEFELIEREIEALRSSPFGFDKKEILQLEKEFTKAKEELKRKKVESLKERVLNLVKSAR